MPAVDPVPDLAMRGGSQMGSLQVNGVTGHVGQNGPRSRGKCLVRPHIVRDRSHSLVESYNIRNPDGDSEYAYGARSRMAGFAGASQPTDDRVAERRGPRGSSTLPFGHDGGLDRSGATDSPPPGSTCD